MIPARPAGYALLALAGLLLLVAGLSAWRGVARLAGHDRAEAAAESAALAFVEAAGTFATGQVEAYATSVMPVATTELQAALIGELNDPATLVQSRSAATSAERAVITSLDGSAAMVTVTAVQTRTWLDARSGRLTEEVRQHTTCRLVRRDGQWLVAEHRVLSEEVVRPSRTR